MLKRSKPLQRRTPIARSKTRIRSATPKRAAQLTKYARQRQTYLIANPICEVWLRENGWQKIGRHLYEGTYQNSPTMIHAEGLFELGAPRSSQIHHMNKRRGEQLNNESEWLAVCHENHERIEQNKKWAREQGFLRNF